MRTTVQLPPDLLRRAKARAAQRGETLKTLLTRAVAAELGESDVRTTPRVRVALPLIGNRDAGPVELSAADLERALANQDAVRAARGRKPRRRRP